MSIITTTPDLAAACSDLAASGTITVDTEFLRETTFWPKLCLIQMASRDQAFLIDALAPNLDLAPFLAVMRNEDVVKVFHAARQDIEIIWRLGGFIPAPVFDTQVAAMVCGFGEAIAYDQLVARVTGEEIDKSQRFTDWSRRPLSEHQRAYALADVTHLHAVYALLKERLEDLGRTEWVREEMHVLTNEATYRAHPEDAWRRLKMRLKRPRELLVLKQIAAWREREAQARDVPRGRILKDDALYEIALHAPRTREELSELRGVPKWSDKERLAEEIVDLVRQALETPKHLWPPLPHRRAMPEGSGAAVELLKVLLRHVSESEKVAAKVLATSDDLEEIVADDQADVPALKGWRRDLFGELALKLKHGIIALSFDGRKVKVVEGPAAGRAQVGSAAAE